MRLKKEEIKKIIPYDEPFLFVDEVEEIQENQISGFWQTSKDDWYFKGHFVDFKIMPGVLIIEAIAQLSTIFLRKEIGSSHKDYHFLAYQIRGIQFLAPVFPDQKIKLKAEILGIYDGPKDSLIFKIANVKGQAFVDDQLKAEARFSVAVVGKKDFEKKYVNFNKKSN